jgi:ligand-binding sensor domain-containing protein
MIRSFAITLFVFQIGFGQNFKQTTFNSTNGLTSPSIFCIKKDKQGYIWLGTNTGVVRYDGKDFVQFELKDGLTAYSVYQIEEDKEGKIWFMTDTGEPNYYFKGQFYNPSNTKILSKLVQPSFLYGFAIDNQNNTWIGSFNDGVKVLAVGGDIINCEDFKTIPIAQKRIIKIWPFLTNQAIIAGGKYIY